MRVNSLGIATARDNLTVHYTSQEIRKTIVDFVLRPVEDARNYFKLGKDARDWKVAKAQEDIRHSNQNPDNIVPVAYRPFDTRYTYYTGKTAGFICMPRQEIMQHLQRQQNIALIALRRPRNEIVGNFFVTNLITDKSIISSLDNAQVFPLYLYRKQIEDASSVPVEERMTQVGMELPNEDEFPYLPYNEEFERRPNLSVKFVREVEAKTGLTFAQNLSGDESTFTPEDLFYYAYAVFHSEEYRERYADFLKIDFPRLPVTSDAALFRQLAACGEELVRLHLMTHELLEVPGIPYPEAGDNKVESGYPRYQDNRVYINQKQFFDNVTEAVWNFYIGGYQVAEKWLKDRRGRTLNDKDIEHYERVLKALAETIRLMTVIDELIPGFPLL